MERKRIVVGVDGSATSREALRWAACLGDVLGAEVVAIHAVGLLEAIHDPDVAAELWRAGLRDVVEGNWCAPLLRARGGHRVEVCDGHPVDVLLAAAERDRTVLLVVGSRGVGANPALALGSTSLRVLQAAHVPVLVVPDRPAGRAPADGVRLRHILVGVDRSDPSLAALELAADLAAMFGGSLSVVEVFEYVPPFPLGPATAVARDGEERALELTAACLEAEVRDIRARGVGVQVIVRSGDPAATLLEVADDVEVDLVVVGTRGRGGPDELLLGSVARTVADRARCPTLAVPAAAGRVGLVRAERDERPATGAES